MVTPRKKVDGRRKKPPSNAGRPPALTIEVQRSIIANRELGIAWERCARLAGVSFASVKNWRAQGESAREKDPNKRTAFDVKCLDFLAACEKSEDEWIRRCETVLAFSMDPGSSKEKWDNASDADKDRAATTVKFKLTHQLPDEYSTKTSTELTGANGGPVDLTIANGEDVFKVLLEAVAVEEASEE
jgi:hypothetical protein